MVGWSRQHQAVGVLAFAVCAGASHAADEAASAAPAPGDRFEGAVGLMVSTKPAFPGASDYVTRPQLAGFLRWGRLTVTGAGGFTTQRKDEVDRGLEAELVRREGLRVGLNLRYDSGRSGGASPDLVGMGDIKRTLRAKLNARWDLNEDWRLNGSIGMDVLNRVGGSLVEIGIARTWRLPAETTAQLGAGLNFATDRYMQAWHGVTPEQSARSGYAAYAVPEGVQLRNASISAVLRREFTPQWAGFISLSRSEALGPAAASPLTKETSSWYAASALVWRF